MRRFTVKPGARFVVVGSALFGKDAYEQEVHQLARSIGIEDAVEFTGFRDDVASIITSLDLIVHASTIGEPFGQVIIPSWRQMAAVCGKLWRTTKPASWFPWAMLPQWLKQFASFSATQIARRQWAL